MLDIVYIINYLLDCIPGVVVGLPTMVFSVCLSTFVEAKMAFYFCINRTNTHIYFVSLT